MKIGRKLNSKPITEKLYDMDRDFQSIEIFANVKVGIKDQNGDGLGQIMDWGEHTS
jgi:hypothetical protein